MSSTSHRKVWLSLLWAILLLVATEFALQARSHLRYGRSVFKAVSQRQTFAFREDLGLKLLRPDSVIRGSRATIESNSLGLRGPEIPPKKDPGEIRIAVLGASTVMGTYTRNNQDVLSYRLEHHLTQLRPERQARVINAGIAGYRVTDQQRMFERVLEPLDIDAVVWYSGVNDIADYCRQSTDRAPAFSLPRIELPSWLLSVELITKNTVWLREVRANSTGRLDPEGLDLRPYRERVESFLETVSRASVPVLVVANARAFRREMPLGEQRELSATARYYFPCFDIPGLHEVFDRHNETVLALSGDYGYQHLRLDRLLAGGHDNFGDATHFSVRGTDLAAKVIAERLAQLPPFVDEPPAAAQDPSN